MALLSPLSSSSSSSHLISPPFCPNFQIPRHLSFPSSISPRKSLNLVVVSSSSSNLCEDEKTLDKTFWKIHETFSEDELWAAACLRVRSFYQFQPSTFAVEDHTKYLAEHEFEALKERFSDNGEDRVVVGSLDLNQYIRLPDEITGSKPKGNGAEFARAYLSNVCVAMELHRNGLSYALVAELKELPICMSMLPLTMNQQRICTGGFDEPAWQARFLDRPRRILLWLGLPISYNLRRWGVQDCNLVDAVERFFHAYFKVDRDLQASVVNALT
ncbi:hypothetical protein RJ641_025386 [Dillenia turbinata]|uniref:Uncharacterized protein n=1 Tax=Dillenia turbinata TaxID=194707 RepID=A0AAN8W6T8_9MAGN